MFLLFPPGWSLNISGVHIGLPLLKGFLNSNGIPVTVRDLNIGLANFYKVSITETDVISACEDGSLSRLNQPFYGAQDKLQCIANSFGGHWDIQTGYSHRSFDSSSSECFRRHSKTQSPVANYYKAEVLPFILNNSASVVGISIVVPAQLQPSFELCRMLRAAGYDGRIYLGGNTVTRIGSKLALDWVFDIVDGLIMYQGEYALLKIWDSLKDEEQDFRDVPNLIWRKGKDVIVNKVRLLQPKDFVKPSFDGIAVNDYWGISYLPVIGARGCYYNKCTFCAIPYAWGPRGYLGRPDASSVLNTMKESRDSYGINRFKFVEEALHPMMTKEIVDLINQEGFECSFEGYARIDSFWCNTGFIEKAARAGLKKVYLGLEIVLSKKRDAMNKADKADQLDLLKMLSDHGVKAHLFFMFGYPGTGEQEAYSTIEFALRNSHLIDSIDISAFAYAKHTVVPGVKPVVDESKDWALEYAYMPTSSESLSSDQAIELSRQLEELIWRDKPRWLHPIYRMYSPWRKCMPSDRQ